jgi:hypothetical protein
VGDKVNKISSLFLIIGLLFASTACSSAPVAKSTLIEALPTPSASEPDERASPSSNAEVEVEPTAAAIVVEYDSDDLSTRTSPSDSAQIKLQGKTISFEGTGATVENGRVTIHSAGTYHISGTLDDGQIIVDSEDEETVVLVLDGTQIASSTSAPLYVLQAEKTVITLADGSENSVTDGANYLFENAETNEPNAAIFSKDDLTINGTGSLTVHANYNNGIVSKDDLKIVGGTITVDAVNDGIKGRDSIAVKGGTITVNAEADGMQANNDEDAQEGYISIEGGTLTITAGLDGIQAETRLAVSGGELVISTGGGSVNSSDQARWGDWGRQPQGNPVDTPSAKGLKAGVDVTITDATIEIDSSDDAIHSNDSLTIDGGEILIASGDDGIHSDSVLQINGGNITITQSYEGIESATLTINGGEIRVVSSDDGLNAAGGRDGSAINGRPGQNTFGPSGNYHLYINGGRIVVDAMGDGLDINGPIDMTDGIVLIDGPIANNNGALDYAGAFNLTGGFLVAVGSAGMAQAPSTNSTQYSLAHAFPSMQAGGSIVHIETQGGENVLTFVPTKEYQSVVFSSTELQNGETYLIYSGGSATGTVTDGLYTAGSYTAGTQVASLTLSGIVTGDAGGRFGGGGMRPPGGGRRHP